MRRRLISLISLISLFTHFFSETVDPQPQSSLGANPRTRGCSSGKRSILSSLSSLNSLSSHIFARAFIPLLRAKGKTVRLPSGQIEEDEHEENEESLTEGEEPAEDR